MSVYSNAANGQAADPSGTAGAIQKAKDITQDPSTQPLNEPVAQMEAVQSGLRQAVELARQMILSEPTSQDGWIAKEDAVQHVDDALAAPRPAHTAERLVLEGQEALKERIASLIREQHLYSIYHCTRVWQAWGVGTMSEDDFEPAAESDLPEGIAEAVLALLTHSQTKQRADNVAWKVGAEFAPFHHQAPHVPPDYRDGWNACFRAATREEALRNLRESTDFPPLESGRWTAEQKRIVTLMVERARATPSTGAPTT